MNISIEDIKNIIKNHFDEIQNEIDIFEEGDRDYRNLDITEDITLILRKSGGIKSLLIGFPFPLESYYIDMFNSKEETMVLVFFRGQKIRDDQRNSFIDRLNKIAPVNYKEISSINKYRELTKKLCIKYSNLDYFDPYSFLGDSFIGLHMVENFIDSFNLNLSTIYSDNYKNLDFVSDSKYYNDKLKDNDNRLVLFVDLLVNQDNRVLSRLIELAKKNIPAIVCGKDLVIIPKNGTIDIFHFNRKEVILRDKNIEDYMDDCLYPYLSPKSNKVKVKKITSSNILLNPFGSDPSKTIPTEIVLNVAKFINRINSNSKLYIFSGLMNNYSHILWTSELKGLINKNNIKNVYFKDYGPFIEIKKDIKNSNISMGITADTSFAHLFNYLGLLNITIFNVQRCDLKSPQSLCSDGPLGFCRYGPVQFPALLNNNITEINKGIEGFINYFLNEGEQTDWTQYLYNSKILISQISSENHDLINSNKKINPLNKIKND